MAKFMAKKVLIIDDEKDILISLSSYLSRNGYDVKSADNGKDGLKLVQEEKPQLIILDLMLPDIDGSDIAARLLEDPQTRDIPVVFLTSMMRKGEQLESGGQIGNRCIIAKPCSSEEILACIKDRIGSP